MGAALFKRINRKPGIVIANIGDASMGCGPVWEGMMVAAMDQYRTLWDEEIGGAPPMLFNFMNNFYGMGGQPVGETMGFGVLARVGMGVNPEAMHAERVDGYNPLAVADAIERKKQMLQRGAGPVLLDAITYRFSGHSPSDAIGLSHQRRNRPLARSRFDHRLSATISRPTIWPMTSELAAVSESTMARLIKVLTRGHLAGDFAACMSLQTDDIGAMMFSNSARGSMDRPRTGGPDPEGREPLEDRRSESTALGWMRTASRCPRLRCLTYAEALFEAMIHRFYEDPTMVAYGEENRDWGGAFGVYRGLTEMLALPSSLQYVHF